MALHVDDINEDRMIALRKRAEVDSKYLLTYTPSDASELKQSLIRHVQFSCVVMSIPLIFPFRKQCSDVKRIFFWQDRECFF